MRRTARKRGFRLTDGMGPKPNLAGIQEGITYKENPRCRTGPRIRSQEYRIESEDEVEPQITATSSEIREPLKTGPPTA